MWLSVIIVALAAYLIFYVRRVARVPRLYYARSPVNTAVLGRMRVLHRPYRPPLFVHGAHAQTLIGARLRSVPHVEFRREYVFFEDGGCAALDWHADAQRVLAAPSCPIVIIAHGLTGGSHEAYVRHFVLAVARQTGWRSVVFNFRGSGDSQLLTPRGYCAGNTDDIEAVIRHVRRTNEAAAALYAVGFSLGANILTNYLGRASADTPLSGAVCMANPFSLLRDPVDHINPVYDSVFTANLIRLVSKSKQLFELHPSLDWELVRQARSVHDFDEAVTVRVFGYESVADYYRDSSCAQRLDKVAVPTLFLNACDDPVVPERVIPKAEIVANPLLALAVSESGGHCAWLLQSSPLSTSWIDEVAPAYLAALHEFQSRPCSRPLDVHAALTK